MFRARLFLGLFSLLLIFLQLVYRPLALPVEEETPREKLLDLLLSGAPSEGGVYLRRLDPWPGPVGIGVATTVPLVKPLKRVIEDLRAAPWLRQQALELGHVEPDHEALWQAIRYLSVEIWQESQISAHAFDAASDDILDDWPLYGFTDGRPSDPRLLHFRRRGCVAMTEELPSLLNANYKGQIVGAAVVADSKLTPAETEACFFRGLAEALGLRAFAVFGERPLIIEADERAAILAALNLLYHPSVKPGMTRQEVVETLVEEGLIDP